jgi:hypothetical protein
MIVEIGIIGCLILYFAENKDWQACILRLVSYGTADHPALGHTRNNWSIYL